MVGDTNKSHGTKNILGPYYRATPTRGGRCNDFNSYLLQPFGRNCHNPAKKAKNRPKIEKKSNLKVDALPYSSTDSTRFYREYYLGIPLSIAGIKNYFG